MPKISIIVPVYKAEKYLHRCVDSILAQTFRDWECILVDDGSPDGSGAICDEYAQKDARIRVIHKENGGVSNARQRGMDAAKGEYVIHADPDDWVEPTMLKELYTKAIYDDADMVICDFIYEYAHKKTYAKQHLISLDSKTILQQLLLRQIHGSCCNKLVRLSCLRNFDIKFPLNVNIWEDLWVCCLLCYEDIRIAYVGKAFYHYDCMINSNSIVRNIRIDYVESQICFCNCFDSLLKNNNTLYDCLWKSKASTKIYMFKSLYYNSDQIINCFPEINERLISEYGGKINFSNISPFCTSLIIRSDKYYPIAKYIYIIIDLILIPVFVFLKSRFYTILPKRVHS